MKTLKLITVFLLTQLAVPALAKMPLDVSMPKTARPGEEVHVSVRTTPKAQCKIEAQDSGLTQTLNLSGRDADANGKAMWNFRIPEDFKANIMPVIVTVSEKGQKAEDKSVNEIKINKK